SADDSPSRPGPVTCPPPPPAHSLAPATAPVPRTRRSRMAQCLLHAPLAFAASRRGPLPRPDPHETRPRSRPSALMGKACMRIALHLLILSAMAAPPLAAQQQRQQQAASTLAAAADAPQPGDVVRLRVWREPELSGEFPVNEDGVVVLPRLGPVDVTRVSADALEQRLIREYSRYLNHAAIEMTLLRRVQILGAVRAPGIYPLDPTMTIADAIAVAGGPAPHGHPNKVELIRGGEKLDIQLVREARIADSP